MLQLEFSPHSLPACLSASLTTSGMCRVSITVCPLYIPCICIDRLEGNTAVTLIEQTDIYITVCCNKKLVVLYWKYLLCKQVSQVWA